MRTSDTVGRAALEAMLSTTRARTAPLPPPPPLQAKAAMQWLSAAGLERCVERSGLAVRAAASTTTSPDPNAQHSAQHSADAEPPSAPPTGDTWRRQLTSQYCTASAAASTATASSIESSFEWLQRTFVVPDTTADDTQEDENCKAARAAVKALHAEHKGAKAALKQAGAPPKTTTPETTVKQPPTTTQATT